MFPWRLYLCDVTLHHINGNSFVIPMLKFAIDSSISEKALVEYIGVCTDTNYSMLVIPTAKMGKHFPVREESGNFSQFLC